jgi:hypothetical protein
MEILRDKIKDAFSTLREQVTFLADPKLSGECQIGKLRAGCPAMRQMIQPEICADFLQGRFEEPRTQVVKIPKKTQPKR